MTRPRLAHVAHPMAPKFCPPRLRTLALLKSRRRSHEHLQSPSRRSESSPTTRCPAQQCLEYAGCYRQTKSHENLRVSSTALGRAADAMHHPCYQLDCVSVRVLLQSRRRELGEALRRMPRHHLCAQSGFALQSFHLAVTAQQQKKRKAMDGLCRRSPF